jgi:hypothetical protein
MKRIVMWSLLCISAILIIGIALGKYATDRARNQAEHFFRRAQTLQLRKSTWNDLTGIVHDSHGETYGFDPCRVGSGQCTGTIVFGNRWLRLLRLAPPVFFNCRFGIKDYHLHNRSCALVSYRKTSNSVVDWGAFVNEGETTNLFSKELEPTSSGRLFKIGGLPSSEMLGVFITPETPADLRALAIDFNFDCLSKIGGCKTVEEMLPILKRRDLVGWNALWNGSVAPVNSSRTRRNELGNNLGAKTAEYRAKL